MAFSTIKDINNYSIGDTFSIALDGVTFPSVRNNGPGLAKNVVLTITVPDGIIFSEGDSTVPRGSLDEDEGTWSVGTMLIGESLTPTFVFEVTDDCEDEYVISFLIESAVCDCNFDNNDFQITVSGQSCCRTNECVSTRYSFDTHAAQASNFGYTVCDDRDNVLLVEPTSDIIITLTGGSAGCVSNHVIIKHIGTGANRVNKIRVVPAIGTIDGDTYFEFDNVGTALNNSRGYNFSSFKFVWSGTTFWVFSD